MIQAIELSYAHTRSCSHSRLNALALVIPLAIALAWQALGGLFLPSLYRDSAWVMTALRSSDITNLALNVPLLLGLAMAIRRGSLRARLASLGIVFYVWENNFYYLAGCAFNRLFLVYAAVSVLSLFGLILNLKDTPWPELEPCTLPKVPRRIIAALLAAMATVLLVLWVGQNVSYLTSGSIPQMIVDAGGSSHLIAALDLTILVPLYLFGAVLLWRGHVWGTLLSAAMLVQGVLTTITLVVTAPVQAAAGIKGAFTMVPVWALMGICFVTATALLFRTITRR